MKLFKFGESGKERCGVVINDELYSASYFFKNYDENFFESKEINNLKAAVLRGDTRLTKIKNPESMRLGAPIGRPSKIVCIGLNYAKHAAESGMAIPPEPIIFFKSTTALCGPNDNLIIPKNSEKNGLGSRVSGSHWKKSELCFGRRSHELCSRICFAQRLFRACFSIRAQWAMGEG